MSEIIKLVYEIALLIPVLALGAIAVAFAVGAFIVLKWRYFNK